MERQHERLVNHSCPDCSSTVMKFTADATEDKLQPGLYTIRQRWACRDCPGIMLREIKARQVSPTP